MHIEKTRERRGVEGARRTTAKPIDESPVAAASPPPVGIVPTDPDVMARPTRRRFTAEDKLRILRLTELRAEGLYASNLATPTLGRGALGLDTPKARPKGLGSASATDRE